MLQKAASFAELSVRLSYNFAFLFVSFVSFLVSWISVRFLGDFIFIIFADVMTSK